MRKSGFNLVFNLKTRKQWRMFVIAFNAADISGHHKRHKLFDALINGRDIKNNKPAPDIYLKGAETLGVLPSECLVVEDAVSGAQAAHDGGMKAACVGDASHEGAGDWNLNSVKELLTLL